MNIRERLELDLAQCKADASRIYEQAPLVGAAYIARRLLQLDRRFTRHAWGWSMPTVWRSGLRVIPAVWGEHDAKKIVALTHRHFFRHDGFRGIERIQGDIDTIAQRIQREFGRGVPDVLSPRAKQWGVALGSLSPDPVTNRELACGSSAPGLADKPGLWPMHRKDGCGYF